MRQQYQEELLRNPPPAPDASWIRPALLAEFNAAATAIASIARSMIARARVKRIRVQRPAAIEIQRHLRMVKLIELGSNRIKAAASEQERIQSCALLMDAFRAAHDRRVIHQHHQSRAEEEAAATKKGEEEVAAAKKASLEGVAALSHKNLVHEEIPPALRSWKAAVEEAAAAKKAAEKATAHQSAVAVQCWYRQHVAKETVALLRAKRHAANRNRPTIYQVLLMIS